MRAVMKRLAAWVIAAAALLAIAGPAVAASTVTYYHNDLAGSPVAATNASAEIVWRESYRPYGERLTKSASAKGNDVWFTSRREDASGLVYMGARYYDPVTGRFVSTDPKGFDEANVQSFNRYAYANNNPSRYVDPDGQEPGSLIQRGYALEIPVFSREPGLEGVRIECALLLATRAPAVSGAIAGEVRLAEKLQAIHEALHPIAQEMRTTGMLRTDLGDLAAGGARDLTPAQRAIAQQMDSIPVKEAGSHAETTLLNSANKMGATPRELVTSRPFCPECQVRIEQSGGTVTSATTAVWK